jgi:hypothetical protein
MAVTTSEIALAGVALGVVGTLAATLLAQSAAGRRERATWERDDRTRWHQQRWATCIEFVAAFRECAQSLAIVAVSLQSGDEEPGAAIVGAMQMVAGMGEALKRMEERLVEIQIVGSEELKTQAEGMSSAIRGAVGGVLFSRRGTSVVPLSIELIEKVAESSPRMIEKFLTYVRQELGVSTESAGRSEDGPQARPH